MSNPVTASLYEDAAGSPPVLVPCTVTSTSPLQITLLGRTDIAGVKLGNLAYSLGPANALVTKVGNPIVLPIG